MLGIVASQHLDVIKVDIITLWFSHDIEKRLIDQPLFFYLY